MFGATLNASRGSADFSIPTTLGMGHELQKLDRVGGGHERNILCDAISSNIENAASAAAVMNVAAGPA